MKSTSSNALWRMQKEKRWEEKKMNMKSTIFRWWMS